MSKIIYALLVLFAIDFSIYLFAGTSYSNSSLFGLLSDPSNLVQSSLYDKLNVALGALGLTTIVIGTFFNLNIYGMYASISAVFLSFSKILVNLWNFINGELRILEVDGHSAIATIVVAPLMLTYLILVANYVRAND